MSSLFAKIKSNDTLKAIALFMISPRNQPRPRLWIKLFVNPFYHKKGKQSTIKWKARTDVFPYHPFTLGRKSVIEDLTVVNNAVGEVYIGYNTFIGMSNVLIGPIRIGNNVITAQHVVMSGLNHGFEDVETPIKDQPVEKKEIVIEDDSWIGANASLMAGITIGEHSIVAAGSVVTKDVPPFTIVGGNPAKPLKHYDFEKKEWVRIPKK